MYKETKNMRKIIVKLLIIQKLRNIRVFDVC